MTAVLDKANLTNADSGRLAHQTSMLWLGTFAGLGGGFLVTALNTRVLGPAEFGRYRLLQLVFALTASVIPMGLNFSSARLLASARADLDERRIFGASLALGSVLCCAFGLVTATITALFPTFAVIPPALLLLGAPLFGVVVAQQWLEHALQGANRIAELALVRAVPSFVYLPLTILLLPVIKISAAAAAVLNSASVLFILLAVLRRLKPSFSRWRAAVADILAENRRYGLHVQTGYIANVAVIQLCGVVLGGLARAEDVGFYTLALTLASPLALLPSSLAAAAFRRFASSKKISPRLSWVTFSISVVALTAYEIFVPLLVRTVFGQAYAPAVRLAQIAGVAFVLHGLGDVINRFLGAHGRGRDLRNTAFAAGGAMLIAFSALAPRMGALGAIMAITVSDAVYVATLTWFYTRYAYHSYE